MVLEVVFTSNHGKLFVQQCGSKSLPVTRFLRIQEYEDMLRSSNTWANLFCFYRTSSTVLEIKRRLNSDFSSQPCSWFIINEKFGREMKFTRKKKLAHKKMNPWIMLEINSFSQTDARINV